jgi:hypothetical protein
VEDSSSNEASFAFKEERDIKSRLSNLELYIVMTYIIIYINILHMSSSLNTLILKGK